MDNFFIDKEKIKVIDTFRIYYFIIFVLSFLFTEFGRFVYRPFIYENKIDDYGLADSICNWGGIIVQIFLNLSSKKSCSIVSNSYTNRKLKIKM